MTVELETANKTTEYRRELMIEMKPTPELLKKWEEQSERQTELKSMQKEVAAVFLCELCNKQYKQVSEYDNHLDSYDHNHLKRMKETMAREMKATHEDNLKKERRQADKEMQRIQKLAMAAQAAAGVVTGSNIPPPPPPTHHIMGNPPV